MIEKEQMMPLLVEASPNFQPEYEAFLEEWVDEANDLPVYIALGDYARYLIRKFDSSNTDDFPAIFETVERLHMEGEHYVREAATIGLLEGIQNIMLNSGKDPERFRQHLQPETLRWWNKLYDFWNKGKLLIDD